MRENIDEVIGDLSKFSLPNISLANVTSSTGLSIFYLSNFSQYQFINILPCQ